MSLSGKRWTCTAVPALRMRCNEVHPSNRCCKVHYITKVPCCFPPGPVSSIFVPVAITSPKFPRAIDTIIVEWVAHNYSCNDHGGGNGAGKTAECKRHSII